MSTRMSGRRAVDEMEDTASDLADLFEDAAELGFRFLTSMTERSARMLPQMPRLKVGSSRCNCEIPPPCWMPVSLGELDDHACEGATATVRFVVTNCGATARQIQVEAVGKQPVKVTGSPINLGPMERGKVSASFEVPDEAEEGARYEFLLWVRGCRSHYLRWTVNVGRRGAECCHEVEVDDCPDLVHHWYDHFYCAHPCGGH